MSVIYYLKYFLYSARNFVMTLADDVRVHDSRSGVEWIHGRINSQFGNASRKHSCCVQVSKCCGRSWISQIIGRYVNCLHGSDRPFLGCGNSLLHTSHVRCECWLVADSRRNTTEQSRHFRTSLSETENVVDEKQPNNDQ